MPFSRPRGLERHRAGVAVGALLFLFFPSPSSALRWEELPKLGKSLTFTGSVRVRYESWNFFEPGPVPNGNNEYDFFAVKTRLGLAYQSKPLEALVEGQWTHFFGLPTDANAPPPFGDLGLGATVFAHHRDRDQGRVFLKQAFLKVNDLPVKGFSVKAGRFEYADGLEVLTKDPALDWVKRARVAERLVGPFGWSHVGRSFDGVQVTFDTPPVNITTLLSRPTQGGFEVEGGEEISGIDLLGATITLKHSALLPGAEGRLFYFFYQDRRDVPKVDNRPAPLRAADRDGLFLSTIGGHLLGGYPLGPGRVDLLLWGASQFGAWGTLDHQAFAFALEGGYQLPKIPLRPWLRVGYFQSSGDPDPLDGDHQTFFQLLPTARLYAQFPFFNLMNLRDLFLQLLLKPLPKLSGRVDLHRLSLEEGNDLWYAGSGATRKSRINGFAGRPSGGADDLAWLVDLGIGYDLTKSLNVNAYYAHAFGGDVIRGIFPREEADFGYVEVNFRF